MSLRNFTFVLAMLALGGCGVARYQSTLPPNLAVSTTVDGGKIKVEAALDIHRMKSDCSTKFLGRVFIDNGEQSVALPVGEPLYIEFLFVSGGGFSSIGSVRQGAFLTPKANTRYRARVSYAKGIYDVELHEGGRGGREIPSMPLSACQPRR